jgi:hypothetical protein
MKDVDLGLARQVQSGRRTYTEAVRDGMYRPLGSGDVDVAVIVRHLRRQGYDGSYVLEQDTILTEKPPRRGPGRRRAHQRRVPAEGDQQQGMSAWMSAGSADSRCPLPLGIRYGRRPVHLGAQSSPACTR